MVLSHHYRTLAIFCFKLQIYAPPSFAYLVSIYIDKIFPSRPKMEMMTWDTPSSQKCQNPRVISSSFKNSPQLSFTENECVSFNAIVCLRERG